MGFLIMHLKRVLTAELGVNCVHIYAFGRSRSDDSS